MDELQVDLLPGDVLLLCSDGLSGPVPPDKLRKALAAGDPEKAARRLVDEALRQGGPDNVTVVVVQLLEEDAGAASDADRDARAAGRRAGRRRRVRRARAGRRGRRRARRRRRPAAPPPLVLAAAQRCAASGRHRGGRVSRRTRELLLLLVAGAVATIAYVSVYAGRFHEISRWSIIYAGIFVAIFGLLHVVVRRLLPQADSVSCCR